MLDVMLMGYIINDTGAIAVGWERVKTIDSKKIFCVGDSLLSLIFFEDIFGHFAE